MRKEQFLKQGLGKDSFTIRVIVSGDKDKMMVRDSHYVYTHGGNYGGGKRVSSFDATFQKEFVEGLYIAFTNTMSALMKDLKSSHIFLKEEGKVIQCNRVKDAYVVFEDKKKDVVGSMSNILSAIEDFEFSIVGKLTGLYRIEKFEFTMSEDSISADVKTKNGSFTVYIDECMTDGKPSIDVRAFDIVNTEVNYNMLNEIRKVFLTLYRTK